MKEGLGRFFYGLVLFVFYVVELILWLRDTLLLTPLKRILKKTPHHKRDWSWGQKLGLLPWRLPKTNNLVMIHCASMGEVVAASPLIDKLLADEPSRQVLVTTNTLTGKEQMSRIKKTTTPVLESRLHHHYLPLDFGWLMKRFIRRVKPSRVIIMEVELWPNFIRQCELQSIPVHVINGRMTDKTTKGYLRLAWLSLPMIRRLTQVFVRNDNDHQNYLKLGLDTDKLFLKGNIKLDITLPSLVDSEAAKLQYGLQGRTILLGGSTHLGEESLLMNAYKQLKSSVPDLALVIVPRHPQRFNEVYQLIAAELDVVRFSGGAKLTATEDVLLVDQMGVLSGMYAFADIAFVGGSFAKRGGHNPIEPAAFAKPVVMGPHIFNNPEICDALEQAGGLVVCSEPYQFYAKLNDWLSDPDSRQLAGQKGRQFLESQQGLVDNIVEQIELS